MQTQLFHETLNQIGMLVQPLGFQFRRAEIRSRLLTERRRVITTHRNREPGSKLAAPAAWRRIKVRVMMIIRGEDGIHQIFGIGDPRLSHRRHVWIDEQQRVCDGAIGASNGLRATLQLPVLHNQEPARDDCRDSIESQIPRCGAQKPIVPIGMHREQVQYSGRVRRSDLHLARHQ